MGTRAKRGRWQRPGDSVDRVRGYLERALELGEGLLLRPTPTGQPERQVRGHRGVLVCR
jgi:hypothetical protein